MKINTYKTGDNEIKVDNTCFRALSNEGISSALELLNKDMLGASDIEKIEKQAALLFQEAVKSVLSDSVEQARDWHKTAAANPTNHNAKIYGFLQRMVSRIPFLGGKTHYSKIQSEIKEGIQKLPEIKTRLFLTMGVLKDYLDMTQHEMLIQTTNTPHPVLHHFNIKMTESPGLCKSMSFMVLSLYEELNRRAQESYTEEQKIENLKKASAVFHYGAPIEVGLLQMIYSKQIDYLSQLKEQRLGNYIENRALNALQWEKGLTQDKGRQASLIRTIETIKKQFDCKEFEQFHSYLLAMGNFSMQADDHQRYPFFTLSSKKHLNQTISSLNPDFENLKQLILSEGNREYCLSIRGNKGGHATAIIRTGDRIFFFDPNYGLMESIGKGISNKIENTFFLVSMLYMGSLSTSNQLELIIDSFDPQKEKTDERKIFARYDQELEQMINRRIQ